MPEQAALIAVFIFDRPHCLDCIAATSGMSAMSAKGYLEKMEKIVTVNHASDERCRACGAMIGNVFSIARRE